MQDKQLLPSQRHLFDMPRDMAWLNCAYMSPLMNQVVAAGEAAVRRKAQPWSITPPDFFSDAETTRGLFGQLINAPADDISIVTSASYGIAVAAANLDLTAGQEIVLLEDQFPSNLYSWRRRANETGARIRTVTRAEAQTARAQGQSGFIDWTTALVEAIGARTAIVTVPNFHWTDGSLIDLQKVGAAARRHGAALVLDLTQSAGAYPFDAAAVQPDFAVAATYKWLLGPYSLGFMYVAPHRQSGRPLEETYLGRAGAENFARLVDYQDEYRPGARRYDMGASANFHLMPMARVAIEQLLEWQVPRIAATLGARNRQIAGRAAGLGFTTAPEAYRAPHLLGLRHASGIPENLLPTLSENNIFISVRGDSLRIAPHLFNDDEDVDRLFAVLETVLG